MRLVYTMPPSKRLVMQLGAIVLVLVASVADARASVTVFLERNGRVTDDGVEIPRFGGGDRTWQGIVTCVREHFAPFEVDIVDRQPWRGAFITAVIGGRASQLGLDGRFGENDDRSTNGIAPYNSNVMRNAVVHVFSKTSGERDVKNLCAATAHEVGHALGLDHTYYCGDIMSYFLDRCGPRKFLDVEANCGEQTRRRCGDGSRSQNSYRRLGELVGFRAAEPEPEPEPVEADPWTTEPDDPDPDADPEEEPAPHRCKGHASLTPQRTTASRQPQRMRRYVVVWRITRQ